MLRYQCLLLTGLTGRWMWRGCIGLQLIIINIVINIVYAIILLMVLSVRIGYTIVTPRSVLCCMLWLMVLSQSHPLILTVANLIIQPSVIVLLLRATSKLTWL